jgi:hypothetical protein
MVSLIQTLEICCPSQKFVFNGNFNLGYNQPTDGTLFYNVNILFSGELNEDVNLSSIGLSATIADSRTFSSPFEYESNFELSDVITTLITSIPTVVKTIGTDVYYVLFYDTPVYLDSNFNPISGVNVPNELVCIYADNYEEYLVQTVEYKVLILCQHADCIKELIANSGKSKCKDCDEALAKLNNINILIKSIERKIAGLCSDNDYEEDFSLLIHYLNLYCNNC